MPISSLNEARQALELNSALPLNEANLKTAWRAAAKKHHPDRNPGNQEEAAEKFKKAKEANEWLEKELKDPGWYERENPAPPRYPQPTRTTNNPFSNEELFAHIFGASFRSSPFNNFRNSNTTPRPQLLYAFGRRRFKSDICYTEFNFFSNSYSFSEDNYITKLNLSSVSEIDIAHIAIPNEHRENIQKRIFNEFMRNPNIIKYSMPSNIFTLSQLLSLQPHLLANASKYENQQFYIMLATSTSHNQNLIGAEKIFRLTNKEELTALLRQHLTASVKSVSISAAKLGPVDAQTLLDALNNLEHLCVLKVNPAIFNEQHKLQLNALTIKANKKDIESFHIELVRDGKNFTITGASKDNLAEKCRRVLYDYLMPFNYQSTIKISDKNLNLPANGANILFNALKRNRYLTNLVYPADLFTNQETNELHKHINDVINDLSLWPGSFNYTLEHTIGGPISQFYNQNGTQLKQLLNSQDVHYISSISLSCSFTSTTHKELIFAGLMKSHHLSKLETSRGFFDEARKNRLDRLIDNNENQKIKVKSKWSFWCALYSVGITALLAGLTFKFLIPALLIGSAFGKAIDTYRVRARQYIGKNYDSVSKINAVEDESVKDALIAGVESKKWTGYLLSFSKYRTYANYGAYSAGLAAALDCNKTLTDEIKKPKMR